MEIIKVAATSNVNSVAGSIALALDENGHVYVQAIGANSINQAVKAIATARGYLAPKNQDLVAIPAYVELQLSEGEKTGIKFDIKLIK
jgi:stage V sporulation protein S